MCHDRRRGASPSIRRYCYLHVFAALLFEESMRRQLGLVVRRTNTHSEQLNYLQRGVNVCLKLAALSRSDRVEPNPNRPRSKLLYIAHEHRTHPTFVCDPADAVGIQIAG